MEAVQALDKMLPVFAVNAHDSATLQALELWLSPGHTLAFLGSSGVGKSTLVNTLLGGDVQETNRIREEIARASHHDGAFVAFDGFRRVVAGHAGNA